MGQKWGSNEEIHIGDIFECWEVNGVCTSIDSFYLKGWPVEWAWGTMNYQCKNCRSK